jgi:hypothetical protein
MGTPIQTQEEKKDKVVLSVKKTIEIVEKEKYSKVLGKEIPIKEVIIDDKSYLIGDIEDFDEIIESLKKKVDVLPYVHNDTYMKLADEILIDIAKIIYKLGNKERV